MPSIELIEPSGKKYYIECKQLPAPGTTGTLEIEHVKRDTHAGPPPYDYVAIPYTPDPQSPVDMKIQLLVDIVPGGVIILPYNGGIPGTEISIKTIP